MTWYLIGAGVLVTATFIGLAVAAWLVGDYDLGIFEEDHWPSD